MIHHGNLKNISFESILLDFDGVIADTEAIFARFDCELINHVLTQAGQAADLTPEYVRTLAGMSGDKKLEHIAKERMLDPTAYMEDFLEQRNARRKILFKDHPPTLSPGLLGLLDNHKGRYALATNKERHKIENDLTCMGLDKYFKDCLFCFENGLPQKPAPDILLAAMCSSDMRPEKTIYIGDNTIDMQAAQNAKTIAVGFIFGDLINFEDRKTHLLDAKAEIIIDDLNDITRIL